MTPACSHSSTSASVKPESSARRSRLRRISPSASAALIRARPLGRVGGYWDDRVDVEPGGAHQRAADLIRAQVLGGGGVDVVSGDGVDEVELLLLVAHLAAVQQFGGGQV